MMVPCSAVGGEGGPRTRHEWTRTWSKRNPESTVTQSVEPDNLRKIVVIDDKDQKRTEPSPLRSPLSKIIHDDANDRPN